MKHISQLTIQRPRESAAPTSNVNASESRSMPSGLTERHVRLLWERMAKIYGHKWVSSYGETDDGTWLMGLGDVTPEQVGAGLEKCRTSAEPWPPTLPEFRSMCMPFKRATAAHSEIAGLLPAPRADKDKAIAEMGKILGMLA